MTLTRSLRLRCGRFIASWSGPLQTDDEQAKPNLSWTCPDCRVMHETVIDPDAEAGRIVEVNCQSCGTQHEASVLFRHQRPGETRMIVGIVWL